MMWVAKGTLLGLWLLGFATIAWLYFVLYRNLPPNSAVSEDIIFALTVRSLLWWVGLVACLVLGLLIARAWMAPLGVWIALAVTGLIPGGLLAMFLILAYKLRHIGPA